VADPGNEPGPFHSARQFPLHRQRIGGWLLIDVDIDRHAHFCERIATEYTPGFIIWDRLPPTRPSGWALASRSRRAGLVCAVCLDLCIGGGAQPGVGAVWVALYVVR
jgi:hypothetical protein